MAPRHVALSSPSRKSLFSLKKHHAWIQLQNAGKVTSGIFSTILVVIAWQAIGSSEPFLDAFLVLPVSGSHVPKPDREGMHGRRLISVAKA